MCYNKGVKKAVLFLNAVLLAGFAAAQAFSAAEYLSVKTETANVREKPHKKAEILWKMWRFMPIQTVAYKGDWIRIRDLDGDTGWMHKDVLHDVPTVMTSTKNAKLRKRPGGRVLWLLDRGYSLRVFGERGEWLEVSDLSTATGWLHKSVAWGYPPPRRRR